MKKFRDGQMCLGLKDCDGITAGKEYRVLNTRYDKALNWDGTSAVFVDNDKRQRSIAYNLDREWIALLDVPPKEEFGYFIGDGHTAEAYIRYVPCGDSAIHKAYWNHRATKQTRAALEMLGHTIEIPKSVLLPAHRDWIDYTLSEAEDV